MGFQDDLGSIKPRAISNTTEPIPTTNYAIEGIIYRARYGDWGQFTWVEVKNLGKKARGGNAMYSKQGRGLMYVLQLGRGLEAGYHNRVQVLKRRYDGAMTMNGEDVM